MTVRLIMSHFFGGIGMGLMKFATDLMDLPCTIQRKVAVVR